MYENKGSHPELNHRHCSHAVCVLIFGSPVYSAHVFLNVIFLMLCAPQTIINYFIPIALEWGQKSQVHV